MLLGSAGRQRNRWPLSLVTGQEQIVLMGHAKQSSPEGCERGSERSASRASYPKSVSVRLSTFPLGLVSGSPARASPGLFTSADRGARRKCCCDSENSREGRWGVRPVCSTAGHSRQPQRGCAGLAGASWPYRVGNKSKLTDESKLGSLSKGRVGEWGCIKLGW